MKTNTVIFVRVYFTESSHLLKTITTDLTQKFNIRGLSVFRATTGFGETGEHTTSLLDFSLDLPLVIEFFDQKEKIEPALEYLDTLIKKEHIVFWPAKTNV